MNVIEVYSCVVAMVSMLQLYGALALKELTQCYGKCSLQVNTTSVSRTVVRDSRGWTQPVQ